MDGKLMVFKVLIAFLAITFGIAVAGAYAAPAISFVEPPTPANGETIYDTSVEIISIVVLKMKPRKKSPEVPSTGLRLVSVAALSVNPRESPLRSNREPR